MPKQLQKVQHDRWLICSDLAFRSLSDFWRSEAGPTSLLAWRLVNDMIEHVPPEQVQARLEELSHESSCNVAVVVNAADASLLTKLQDQIDQLDVELVEWSERPLPAVLVMNAPDQKLLSALNESEDADLEMVSPIDDQKGYIRALKAWEEGCRDNDLETFATAFPTYAARPIPWSKIFPSKAVPQDMKPVANDNWIELVRLAASTSSNQPNPVSLKDPNNEPAQWTLTLSPIDDGPATLVIFRVNDSAIPAFQGCKIKLRVRGDVIDLGEIDSEGQAEIILPSLVEMQGLAITWEEQE